LIRVAAIVLPSCSPAPSDWFLARLAGLSHRDRLIATLRRAGIDDVRIVEAGHVAGDVPRACRPLLVVDGRRLYAPSWIEAAVGGAGPGDFAAGGRPSGLRVAPEGAALDGAWTDFERVVPGAAQLSVPAGAWSVEVQTPQGRHRAREQLRLSLAKPTDGWFARRFNRPISTRLSIRLASLGVHPDLATAAALALAVAAAWSSALGTWAGFAVGGLLFQLASVADGVDGELARLRFSGSGHGEWLDTVCDDLSNLMFFIGVTAGVARAGYPAWLLAAGLVTIAMDVLTVSVMYWTLAARGDATLLAFEADLDRPAFGRGLLPDLARRFQPFVKRDAYAFLFMLAAVAGAPWVPLVTTPPALAFTLAGFARIVVVQRESEA